MFDKTIAALKSKFSKGNTTMSDTTTNVPSDCSKVGEGDVKQTSTLNKKGIVAIVTALAVYIGAKFGYDMPEDTTGTIVDTICVLVLAIANWKK